MKRLFTIHSIIAFFMLIFGMVTAHANTPFQLSTGFISHEGIQLNWTVDEDNYLYKKFISVVSLTPNIQIGTPIFPEGDMKNTHLFGRVMVYHDSISITVPIENPKQESVLKLEVSYQGCSERGQCYPPVKERLEINLDTQNSTIENPLPSSIPNETIQEVSQIEQSLQHHSILWIFGGFFLLGLALSITPCVLPMIPILSGIILSGHSGKKIKAFTLSLAYVVGMALAYAVLGFLMSMVSQHIQAFLQNTYVLIAFSLIFVLFAASLFGFFEISWSHHKISGFNQRLAKIACKNHSIVLCMGFLSALIVSPCVTPPLVGALSYISSTGNVTLGTTALFFMGLGLGTPLLLIGVLEESILPKKGRWMEHLKFLMGIPLLGMAFFLIQRIIPKYSLILWSVFSLITFIILLYHFDFNTRWKRGLFQTICFLGIVGSGFLIIHDVFTTSLSSRSDYIAVTNEQQLEQYLKLAKKEHKPVIIDFYADWCPDCQWMEQHVFNQTPIINLLKNFVWLKVDMTKDSENIWALQEKLNVSGPPTFLFYDADGKPLKQLDFVGQKSEKDIKKILGLPPFQKGANT